MFLESSPEQNFTFLRQVNLRMFDFGDCSEKISEAYDYGHTFSPWARVRHEAK